MILKMLEWWEQCNVGRQAFTKKRQKNPKTNKGAGQYTVPSKSCVYSVVQKGEAQNSPQLL